MNKLKKKYIFLFIIVIIGVVIGVLFSNILSTNDEKLVYTQLSSFFNNIKNDEKINYLANLWTNLKNNLFYLIAIWIFGLSVIGLIINNFLLFFKSFTLGFIIGSIINTYLYSGLVLSFAYIFPNLLINLFVYIIMVYYANDISLKLFNVLFKKKEQQFGIIIKKYLKLLGILSLIIFLSSLYETFITPFVLKLFSFLIK